VRPFGELKRGSLDHFGVELVLDRVLAAIAPLGTRPVLISFSLEALAEARKRSRLAIGPVFDHWRDREDPRAAELAPEFVFCDADGLPSSGELRHAGARVAVYEVDDAAVARSLAARGVELVETFSIAELAAALRAAP
jgi:glycerophosphoryl diester phosphodiesterase